MHAKNIYIVHFVVVGLAALRQNAMRLFRVCSHVNTLRQYKITRAQTPRGLSHDSILTLHTSQGSL